MQTGRPWRVGIMAAPLPSYIRDLYRGILCYANRETHWTMQSLATAEHAKQMQASPLGLDGLIAYVGDAETAEALHALKLPCVNVSSALPDAGFPAVWPDNEAVGRLAADHLAERGFRHFAYLGYGNAHYAQRRGDAFRAAVERRGFDCHGVTDGDAIDFGPGLVPALMRWIETLPLPCGVLACTDGVAAALLEACLHQAVRVPEDIGVVGVNDEATLCAFTTPPLSSVPIPGYEIGYRAAGLLDRWMRGRRPPARPIVLAVPPLQARRSSESAALSDPLIMDALRWIRERAGRNAVAVEEVARELSVSRRTLDRRFKRALGWLPKDAIDRERLDRLRWYLAETSVPLKCVWSEMGFSSPKEPARFLRRLTGLSPTEYRRRNRCADRT